MKTLATITLSLLFIAAMVTMSTGRAAAQTCDGNGSNFVDLNGDGFNDNAPDADGDGIPNGLDPDYIKHEQDGDGYQHKGDLAKGKADAKALATPSKTQTMTKSEPIKAQNQTQSKSQAMNKGDETQAQTMTKAQLFYRLQAFSGFLYQNAYGYGMQNGGHNGSSTGVCDGSGSGAGSGSGTGVCDGTGPHGTRNQGGK